MPLAERLANKWFLYLAIALNWFGILGVRMP
jgi:hypothetical protein